MFQTLHLALHICVCHHAQTALSEDLAAQQLPNVLCVKLALLLQVKRPNYVNLVTPGNTLT
jgi:hypothetical protein